MFVIEDAIRILTFADNYSENSSIEKDFLFGLPYLLFLFLAEIRILQSNLTLEEIRQKAAQLRKEVNNMVM